MQVNLTGVIPYRSRRVEEGHVKDLKEISVSCNNVTDRHNVFFFVFFTILFSLCFDVGIFSLCYHLISDVLLSFRVTHLHISSPSCLLFVLLKILANLRTMRNAKAFCSQPFNVIKSKGQTYFFRQGLGMSRNWGNSFLI